MLEIGRLCIKTAGREAGKACVVVKSVDSKFVMVTGPREITRVKRRKCNILHLEPLEDKLPLKSDASDSDVIKAYKEAGIIKKLGLHIPTAEEARKLQQLRASKDTAKKVREEKAKKEQEELERKRKEEERKKQEAKKREEAKKQKPGKKKEGKPAEKEAGKKPEAKKPAEKEVVKEVKVEEKQEPKKEVKAEEKPTEKPVEKK